MPRYFLADLRTGRQILELPVLSGPWSDTLNEAESLSVTVDLQDPDVRALDLRNTAAPCKTVLAVAEGDTIMASGPIWTRSYSRNSQKIQLNAKGWLSYFDHRHILPLVAKSIGLDQFLVADPEDPTKTIANPLLTTMYESLGLGTIAKRLMQQAQTWTGGNIPLVFQPDESGTHEREYLGPEFNNIGDEIRNLMNVEGGPDIKLKGRLTEDRLGIECVVSTGTEAKPRLASEVIHVWDLTVPESSASNLNIDEDGSNVASLAWATGGNAGDTVLVGRSYDPTLVDNGFPLYELPPDDHPTAKVQKTLDAYAAEAAFAGRATTEVWSFDVEANEQPTVGSYATGDYCDLVIAPYVESAAPLDGLYPADSVFPGGDIFPVDGNPWYVDGDPYVKEGGKFRHRIIGISGDEKGEVVNVQCAPSRTV